MTYLTMSYHRLIEAHEISGVLQSDTVNSQYFCSLYGRWEDTMESWGSPV